MNAWAALCSVVERTNTAYQMTSITMIWSFIDDSSSWARCSRFGEMIEGHSQNDVHREQQYSLHPVALPVLADHVKDHQADDDRRDLHAGEMQVERPPHRKARKDEHW